MEAAFLHVLTGRPGLARPAGLQSYIIFGYTIYDKSHCICVTNLLVDYQSLTSVTQLWLDFSYIFLSKKTRCWPAGPLGQASCSGERTSSSGFPRRFVTPLLIKLYSAL